MYGHITFLVDGGSVLTGLIYIQQYGNFPGLPHPGPCTGVFIGSRTRTPDGLAEGMNVTFSVDENQQVVGSSVVWDGSYTGPFGWTLRR
jgi:hypothetical protein